MWKSPKQKINKYDTCSRISNCLIYFIIHIDTFCSGAELIVKGCHSWLAISGIFTKTQSPGQKLNFSGRRMIRLITLEGSRSPAWILEQPAPLDSRVEATFRTISNMYKINGAIKYFQKFGQWQTSNTQYTQINQCVQRNN